MSDFYEKIRDKAYQKFKIPYHKSIAPTISIYAAYLYDAVMIYAQAATEVLLNKGDLRDGKSLMENYIFNRSYSSIQGFDVRTFIIILPKFFFVIFIASSFSFLLHFMDIQYLRQKLFYLLKNKIDLQVLFVSDFLFDLQSHEFFILMTLLIFWLETSSNFKSNPKKSNLIYTRFT